MRKRQKVSFKFWTWVLVTLIVIFTATYIGKQFRKEVGKRAEYYGKILATQTVNDSVSKVLDKNLKFLPIEVLKDTSGKVVSVETKVGEISKVKTEITEEIINKLTLLSKKSFDIPLGNLTGNTFLSAKGPNIKCEFIPVGSVDVKTVSKFETAGINQTRHSLLIMIDVKVMAITSFCTVTADSSSDFVLAETVIVGSVPDSYTQVLTDDKEFLGEINDYKAD